MKIDVGIPKCMAVGVVLAIILSSGSVITTAGDYVLATGIAIQSFPEGATISMPLVSMGLGVHFLAANRK